MPLFLNIYTTSDIKKEFKRIEVGVRISCPAIMPCGLLYKVLILSTFTEKMALNGALFVAAGMALFLLGSYNSMVTYSGRADCPKTGVL